MNQTIKSQVEQTTNAVIVESRIARNTNYPYSGRFYSLEDVENIMKHLSERIIEDLDGIELPAAEVQPSRWGLSEDQLENLCSQVAESLHALATDWADDCVRNFDFDEKISLTTEGYGTSLEVKAEFENYDIESEIFEEDEDLLESMTNRIESVLVNELKIEVLSNDKKEEFTFASHAENLKRDLQLERIEEGECESHN
jgi:hypothetical protein